MITTRHRTNIKTPLVFFFASRFRCPIFLLPRVLLLWIALFLVQLDLAAAEAPPVPTNGLQVVETNSQEILRAYLQLQEQLHATQLAVEQNRRDAREAATQSSDTLAVRLQSIEQALSSQRARELDAMQSSNRVMLIVAGSFAAVGFLAMLLMAYFQFRTVNGLAEISASLTPHRALGAGPALAALGPGDPRLVTSGSVDESNQRLLGAIQHLQKRLYDLEHTGHAPLKESNAIESGSHTNGNGDAPADPAVSGDGGPADKEAERENASFQAILDKGQSMLNLDKPEAALDCFNQVLALQPNHADALVKKGIALERLQKLPEAIQCYDGAIAADDSMTIAYLHKGGLFNRMERFSEALECYEKALRTQERRQV